MKVLLSSLILVLVPPAGSHAPEPPASAPATADPAARDLPGLHNVVAFHDGFWSGSVPEGDAGFASLKALGVRTII